MSVKAPSNHRMNTEEVPKVTGEQLVMNLTETAIKKLSSGEFPYNVDFVEQPDLFEIGQSFFMPTFKSPSAAPEPHLITVKSPLSDTRWSRPFDVPNGTIDLVTPASFINSSTLSPYIVFDDENEPASLATAPVNGAYSTAEAAVPMIDESTRRKQIKLALDRHLAEQSRLLSVLSRRLDARLGSGSGSGSGTGASEARNSWTSIKSDKVLTLAAPGGPIRSLVPANHVVRHPKAKQRHFLADQKFRSLKQHEARSSSRLDSASDPIMKQPETGQSSRKASREQAPEFSAADTNKGLKGEIEPLPLGPRSFGTGSSVQRNGGTPVTQLEGAPGSRSWAPDYSKLMDMSPAVEDAFASLTGASDASFSKLDKPAYELANEDEDEPGGGLSEAARAAAAHWEDLPGHLHQLAGQTDERRAHFNPYAHHLFAEEPLESGHRDAIRGQLAPGRSVKVYRLKGQSGRGERVAQYSSQPVHFEDYYPIESGAGPRAHSFRHQAGHHEHGQQRIVPGYVASPSKKIIHIHTNEKKGHAKYLWPILGGGLTMLMGFLIISNMLLSIPLLAMGASTLFGHGGYHTQQLVPVYNLSQLRPPSGRRRRRRRRWTREGPATRSIALAELTFANVLRRILASLARGGQCRSNFQSGFS